MPKIILPTAVFYVNIATPDFLRRADLIGSIISQGNYGQPMSYAFRPAANTNAEQTAAAGIMNAYNTMLSIVENSERLIAEDVTANRTVNSTWRVNAENAVQAFNTTYSGKDFFPFTQFIKVEYEYQGDGKGWELNVSLASKARPATVKNFVGVDLGWYNPDTAIGIVDVVKQNDPNSFERSVIVSTATDIQYFSISKIIGHFRFGGQTDLYSNAIRAAIERALFLGILSFDEVYPPRNPDGSLVTPAA